MFQKEIRLPCGRAESAATLMLAALLTTALSWLHGCSPPQGKVRFFPEQNGRGMDSVPRIAYSAPRSRAQHTFGSVGENLFPSPSADGKTRYYASSR